MTAASGPNAQKTTSAHGQRVHSPAAADKHTQKDHVTPNERSQVGGQYQSPMLRRYLEQGMLEEVGKLRDRDGYPKGEEGMRRYLDGWDEGWRGAEVENNGQTKT